MQGFPGNLEAESALGKRKAPPANAVPETGPVGGVSGTGQYERLFVCVQTSYNRVFIVYNALLVYFTSTAVA